MGPIYRLRSSWVLPCSREQLWAVLDEMLARPDPLPWWPSVEVLDHRGDEMDLRAVSHLGYAVRFTLHDLVREPPTHVTFGSRGDLRGSGRLDFAAVDAERCRLSVGWDVATTRPWMRRTSWLLRPVFVAGHRLLMRQARRRLRRWLVGRSEAAVRAEEVEER